MLAIANNVVFKYHDEIEKLPGSTGVREMLVKDATVYLDNLAADAQGDPDLARELALAYLKLGDVQGRIYAPDAGNTAGALEKVAPQSHPAAESRVASSAERPPRSSLLKVGRFAVPANR